MQIQETEPSKAIQCRWKIQTAPVSRTWRGNTAEGRPGDVPGRRREYASLSRTFLAPGQRALRADLECIAAPAPGGRPGAGGTAPSAPSRLHQLHQASAAHNAGMDPDQEWLPPRQERSQSSCVDSAGAQSTRLRPLVLGAIVDTLKELGPLIGGRRALMIRL